MFKVGEKVVYPAHGVGEIEAIRSHVISGTEKKFYMLRILETDMKIMIPIDNVDSVGLRKIIDRAMVTKVYKVLRQKKVETDQQTWNRRYPSSILCEFPWSETLPPHKVFALVS